LVGASFYPKPTLILSHRALPALAQYSVTQPLFSAFSRQLSTVSRRQCHGVFHKIPPPQTQNTPRLRE
jgi:hypothetical protein